MFMRSHTGNNIMTFAMLALEGQGLELSTMDKSVIKAIIKHAFDEQYYGHRVNTATIKAYYEALKAGAPISMTAERICNNFANRFETICAQREGDFIPVELLTA